MKPTGLIPRLTLAVALAAFAAILVGCLPEDNAKRDDKKDTTDSAFFSAADPANFVGSIGGTVYINGHPQAFGTVQVFDTEGNLVSQERCSQTGHYTIKDLKPGTYKLVYLNARAAPLGEETIVQVRPGRFEQVDLQLSTKD